MDPLKPGYKTTEFYITIVTSGIGVALMLGYITPEQAKTLTEQSKVFIDAVTVAVGAIMAIVPILAYLVSRIKLKTETNKSITASPALPAAAVNAKPTVGQISLTTPSYIVR